MHTAHHPLSNPHSAPLRSRSRLTFNEQLCFFAVGDDTGLPQASYGWWATLAVVLAIAPWAAVGLMIWMFV